MSQSIAPQGSSITRVSFAEVRGSTFFSIRPELKKDIEYVEQLASQTGESVADRCVSEFLEGLQFGDRRGINKRFFARVGEKKSAPALESIPEIIATEAIFSATVKHKVNQLKSRSFQMRSEAVGLFRTGDKKISEAWTLEKEILILEGRPHNYLGTELHKLLQEGFWEFARFDGGVLHLITKNNVVLTEINAAAGVANKVVMGKYRASLDLNKMRLTVHKYKNNLVSPSRFYHPYVEQNGDICWGSAAETMTNNLALGRLYDSFQLLSALLTTYSNGTPWERLSSFACIPEEMRVQSRLPHDTSESWCNGCQESIDSCQCVERCGGCENPIDNCSCDGCSVCNERYVDGDRECDCCMECEREDCICCGTCGDNSENCGCCPDCGSTEDNCTYCGGCERHCDTPQEHDQDCESYVAPATTG